MANKDVVLIPAVVESASPDRSQYKPYSTTLSFGGELIVMIPVPAEEVEKKGGKIILTLKGWTILLDAYTSEVEKMDGKYQQDMRTATPHRPF